MQTSAKRLNFTNCAGTQTLIRQYCQSYLERRSWREKKFCMCEGVSFSLFWGRNFSASVEWCGGKKPKIHLVVHSHSPLTKTCSDFGFVWYCYLLQIFCRAVLAGFSQCHVCDQRDPPPSAHHTHSVPALQRLKTAAASLQTAM